LAYLAGTSLISAKTRFFPRFAEIALFMAKIAFLALTLTAHSFIIIAENG
jgi:hypothetical protein